MPPRDRVESYLREFLECWTSAKARMPEEVDFDVWSPLVAALDARHWRPGIQSPHGHEFSTPPAHSPDLEHVVSEEVRGDVARVETENAGPLLRFWEYQLERAGEDWLISGVWAYPDPPNGPFVAPEELGRLMGLASDDAPLPPLAADNRPLGDALFVDGGVVERSGETFRISVRLLGDMHVGSGVLCVRDLGEWGEGISPLRRKVMPGTYPVEVAITEGRVAGVRVRLRPGATVVAWHPAECVGGGDAVAVEGGNVGIFDLGSLGAHTVRTYTIMHEENVAHHQEQPLAHLFALRRGSTDSPPDCAVVASGWGDGYYPCNWGVDERGRLVTLAVEFL